MPIATGRAKRDPTGDLRGALPAVRPTHFAAITAADQGALPITADQRIELDRRLNAYAVNKNRGRHSTDAVWDIRRQL